MWVLLTSPLCREKILAHLTAQADGMDVKIDDQTTKTVQIAVVGPAAKEILDAVLPFKVSDLGPCGVKAGSLLVARYIGVRGNLGGMWSLEVILPNMAAGLAWNFITVKAGANAIAPAGTAAMDVLRIEAGQLRYGHELNETIDPQTAGLGRLLRSEPTYIGAAAVAKLAAPTRVLAGIVFEAAAGDKLVRQGEVVHGGDGGEVGVVTSSTFSPVLGRPVAIAYLGRSVQTGADVKVGDFAGKVQALPFVGA